MKSFLSLLLISSFIFPEILGNKYQELQIAKNSDSKVSVSREEFQGTGEIKCYGYISVSGSKWDTVTGTAACRPRLTGAAPQGYVADGDDGSHWVVIDDKGQADCEGEVTYTAGDIGLGYCTQKKNPMSDIRKFSPKLMTGSLNPRLFCGYFTCTGVLNLVCDGMLSGCHG